MPTAEGLRILLIKPKARLRAVLGLQAYQILEPLELRLKKSWAISAWLGLCSIVKISPSLGKASAMERAE